MKYIGQYAGTDIYLDSELHSAVIALIKHQQDELERIKAELTIEGTMKRLIDREDG